MGSALFLLGVLYALSLLMAVIYALAILNDTGQKIKNFFWKRNFIIFIEKQLSRVIYSKMDENKIVNVFIPYEYSNKITLLNVKKRNKLFKHIKNKINKDNASKKSFMFLVFKDLRITEIFPANNNIGPYNAIIISFKKK